MKPGNLSVFEKVLNPAKCDASKDKRVNTCLQNSDIRSLSGLDWRGFLYEKNNEGMVM